MNNRDNKIGFKFKIEKFLVIIFTLFIGIFFAIIISIELFYHFYEKNEIDKQIELIKTLISQNIITNIPQNIIDYSDKYIFKYDEKHKYSSFLERYLLKNPDTYSQHLARVIEIKKGKKTLELNLFRITLAYKIKQNFKKNQIIRVYLNRLYFFNKQYGIENASRYYFNKNMLELTNVELCTLFKIANSSPKNIDIIKEQCLEEDY
ncbi:transglycosylase domain-containing protein [bacterium]|nr:transglycosylase domain-containing protein [bacterium]